MYIKYTDGRTTRNNTKFAYLRFAHYGCIYIQSLTFCMYLYIAFSSNFLHAIINSIKKVYKKYKKIMI